MWLSWGHANIECHLILLKIKGNNAVMSSDYFLQFLQPHAELRGNRTWMIILEQNTLKGHFSCSLSPLPFCRFLLLSYLLCQKKMHGKLKLK